MEIMKASRMFSSFVFSIKYFDNNYEFGVASK